MRHINTQFIYKITLKILDVDDSKDITEALEMTFEVLGHDFSSTNSGKSKIAIKDGLIDVLIKPVSIKLLNDTLKKHNY